MAQESFGPHVDGDRGEWAGLGRLAKSDPDKAWSRLLEVAARTDEAGLFWVGDIIEDLIAFHGGLVEGRLEAELETNEALRRAFVDVSPRSADEALSERLLAIRERIEAEQ